MGRFDMLGAARADGFEVVRREVDLQPRKAEPREDTWIAVAATLAGGAIGSFLVRRTHPVLGLLNGFAVGGNLARVATGEITVRRAAENLGAHAVATAGSLGLPSHPAIGYVAGAAASNLLIRREDTYLERLDETLLGNARRVRGLLGPAREAG